MENTVIYKGKRYDLTQSGPCCDWYAEKRKQEATEIKIMNTLTGGIPRSVVMWGEIRMNNRGPFLTLDGESCPCKESPEPVLFRKLMLHRLNGKSLDDALDALVLENPVLANQ